MPVLLVAAIFLLADLLFQRPPGLMTAIVVVATEMIRLRWQMFRSLPFLFEWLWVALAILAITFANRIALAIVMMPQAPLAMTTIETGLTILVYPLVVGGSLLIFGVRRRAPGEVDALGHRL